MKKVTVRYVRFLSPGSFVANDWTVQVDSADPRAVKWPENAYAFTLHEREDMVHGTETYTGKTRQIGPRYYHPDSTVVTEAEIAARGDPNDSVLLSNMRCNKWPAVVYSRWGNWSQPYEPGESVVLRKSNPTT